MMSFWYWFFDTIRRHRWEAKHEWRYGPEPNVRCRRSGLDYY